MKCLIHVLVFGLFLNGALSLAQPEPDLDAAFQRAQVAYDEQDFGKAISLYESILNSGSYNPELFYNLGNAFFQNGEVGKAVVNYRRSERFMPRHPDLQLNLKNALSTTGATVPPPSGVVRVFSSLPHNTWILLAMFSFWVGAGIACLFCFIRPGTIWWIRCGLACAALTALGLTGGHFTALENQPMEAVIIDGATPVRFAPIPNADSSFDLPEGTVALVRSTKDNMTELQSGKQRGWVSNEAILTVWPPVQRP